MQQSYPGARARRQPADRAPRPRRDARGRRRPTRHRRHDGHPHRRTGLPEPIPRRSRYGSTTQSVRMAPTRSACSARAAQLVGAAPCIVHVGEGFLDHPIAPYVESLQRRSLDLVLLCQGPSSARGIIRLGEAGRGGADRPSILWDAGIGVFGPGAFRDACQRDPGAGPSGLGMLAQQLSDEGEQVEVSLADGWRSYRGDPQELLELNRLALDLLAPQMRGANDQQNQIEGRVHIDRTASVTSQRDRRSGGDRRGCGGDERIPRSLHVRGTPARGSKARRSSGRSSRRAPGSCTSAPAWSPASSAATRMSFVTSPSRERCGCGLARATKSRSANAPRPGSPSCWARRHRSSQAQPPPGRQRGGGTFNWPTWGILSWRAHVRAWQRFPLVAPLGC